MKNYFYYNFFLLQGIGNCCMTQKPSLSHNPVLFLYLCELSSIFEYFIHFVFPCEMGQYKYNAHVCVCVQSLSCVRLFVAPWTVAGQAPLCMEFSRQKASPAFAGATSTTWEAPKTPMVTSLISKVNLCFIVTKIISSQRKLCSKLLVVSSSKSHSAMSSSFRPHGLQPARLLCPWNSPGRNTGVGNLSLLQGLFPAQGWNSGLSHCRQILFHLSHQGIPFYSRNM